MTSKKKNDMNNSTKDNPYDNYHGHKNSGQNLDNSTQSRDSKKSTGKDSKKKNNNK